jgi:hypothetical protein
MRFLGQKRRKKIKTNDKGNQISGLALVPFRDAQGRTIGHFAAWADAGLKGPLYLEAMTSAI